VLPLFVFPENFSGNTNKFRIYHGHENVLRYHVPDCRTF